MKQIGWLVLRSEVARQGGLFRGVALAAVAAVLLLSAAFAAEKLRVSDIKGLVSGELIVQPADLNPIPIGQGGYPTGFAFAPGRAELAYTTVEEKGGGSFSALRIVRAERLWPVPREVEKSFTDRQGRKHNYRGQVMVPLPFAERERQLLRFGVKKAGERFVGPLLEGPILWSPDATKLAVFAVIPNDLDSYTTRDLWIIDYATGKKQALSQGMWVGEAVWSPDSKWLAFVVAPGDKKPTPQKSFPTEGLWLTETRLNTHKRIASGGFDLEWPAPGRLVFRQSGESPKGLEYQLESGKSRTVSVAAGPESPWEISPDKRYLAVSQEEVAGKRLEIKERSTGAVKVTLPGEFLGGWNPDSELLAFIDHQGILSLTSAAGVHQGHIVRTAVQNISLLPLHPPVDWSARQTPGGLPSDAQEISWIAFAAQDGLRVLCLSHRQPHGHEAAALGLLTPEKERETVINNMKQVGLSLIQYSTDWDNRFPANDARIYDTISPYLRNREIFDRPGYPNQPVVRYLGSAGPISRVESPNDPGAVPVAVVDYWTDGGVVAYADGHVKWEPRENIEALLRKAEEVFGPPPVRN